MNFITILSYFLWSSPIFFSFLAISASNPLNSVIALILVFLFSALYLISIANSFIALIYLIIYVGAIAVLFLFVVMMMNLKLVELNRPKSSFFYSKSQSFLGSESSNYSSSHIPLAGIILSIYFFWALGLGHLPIIETFPISEFSLDSHSIDYLTQFFSSSFTFWDLFIHSTHPIFSIAYIFYSNYIFFLIGLSLLLLLAIIGPILLFLNDPI